MITWSVDSQVAGMQWRERSCCLEKKSMKVCILNQTLKD